MNNLPPYLDEVPPWINEINGFTHIIFDSDAIISIISNKADLLLNQIKKKESTFCLIHPVYIELLQTDNSAESFKRQNILSKYEFLSLLLTKKDFDMASDIQKWLTQNRSFTASATDLYLGSKLASFSKDVFLLTGDLKDFPYPLYNRKARIILQNNKESKILYFLTFNHDELGKISFKNDKP